MSPYTSDYTEIDPSPLATQSRKFLAEQEAAEAAKPSNFFARECLENPSSPHCRVFDV
jgi:hypothetical protein